MADKVHSEALSVAARFVAKARRVTSPRQLGRLLEQTCCALGYRHFALVHHADLRSGDPTLIRVDNYPRDWAERFVEQQFYAIDPVQQASRNTNLAFPWSEVPSLLKLTSRQVEIMEASARAGLRSGITVPLHIPGEPSGSCSFATDGETDAGHHALASAQVIGSFAFEHARRLARRTGPVRLPRRLSPRQRQCLQFAAQGKTDWEIGRILDLSEETVTKYLNAARARYGVSRRVQLAVVALFEGELSFSDVVRR